MKNTMFADNINEKVKAVRDAITDLIYCAEPNPEKTEMASDLEKIHTLCFMKCMGSLIEESKAIEYLVMDSTAEEFEKMMTDDGEKTVSEVKKEMMLSLAMEALMKNQSEED